MGNILSKVVLACNEDRPLAGPSFWTQKLDELEKPIIRLPDCPRSESTFQSRSFELKPLPMPPIEVEVYEGLPPGGVAPIQRGWSPKCPDCLAEIKEKLMSAAQSTVCPDCIRERTSPSYWDMLLQEMENTLHHPNF